MGLFPRPDGKKQDPYKFNLGAMVAQGCHVVSKTLWELREEANVQEYMRDMDNMHKVILHSTIPQPALSPSLRVTLSPLPSSTPSPSLPS